MNKNDFNTFFEEQNFYGRIQNNGVQVIQNRNAQLETQPHYSDSRFSKGNAILVFGSDEGREKDLWVNYDDRLMQFDYEKHKTAWQSALDSGLNHRSANFYEKYLSEYHDQQMRLVWVKAGVNRSSGYPYVVFGYKPIK